MSEIFSGKIVKYLTKSLNLFLKYLMIIFFFLQSTIQDLFNVNTNEDASTRMAEVVDREKERKERLQKQLDNQVSIIFLYISLFYVMPSFPKRE